MAEASTDQMDTSLNKAIVTGQRFASLLGSVTEEVQKIDNEQRDLERVQKENPTVGTKIAEEIRKLERKFRDCIQAAKWFLWNCGSAAEYGLNEEILKRIQEELEQENNNTLQLFLSGLENRFDQSNVPLENFNSSLEKANEIAKRMMSTYKENLEKATSDVDKAKEKHQKAALSVSKRSALKTTFTTVAVGSVVMIGLYPVAGLVMAVASGTGALTLFLSQYEAAADGLKAKNDLRKSIREQSSNEQAIHSTGKYQTEMSGLSQVVDDVTTDAGIVQMEASNEEGLGMPTKPEKITEKEGFKQGLKDLHTALSDLLKVVEKGKQLISELLD